VKSELRPHGTYTRYKNGLCRCTDCTAANAAYLREYRRAGRDPHPKIQRRHRTLAMQWLRENRLDVYYALKQQATEDVRGGLA
jgi:hypothetical protein